MVVLGNAFLAVVYLIEESVIFWGRWPPCICMCCASVASFGAFTTLGA